MNKWVIKLPEQQYKNQPRLQTTWIGDKDSCDMVTVPTVLSVRYLPFILLAMMLASATSGPRWKSEADCCAAVFSQGSVTHSIISTNTQLLWGCKTSFAAPPFPPVCFARGIQLATPWHTIKQNVLWFSWRWHNVDSKTALNKATIMDDSPAVCDAPDERNDVLWVTHSRNIQHQAPVQCEANEGVSLNKPSHCIFLVISLLSKLERFPLRRSLNYVWWLIKHVQYCHDLWPLTFAKVRPLNHIGWPSLQLQREHTQSLQR